MHPSTSTLQAAIDRNLAEANNAILKQVAHDELLRQNIVYVKMSFFAIAADALYSDMISHAIRILDEHRDACGFWYIFRCNEAAVRRAYTSDKFDLEQMKTMSTKLRTIREKTKFHIDRIAVKKPAGVWKKEEIDGQEFVYMLHAVSNTLANLKLELFGGDLHKITEYDGSDISRIVKALESVHGRTHGA